MIGLFIVIKRKSYKKVPTYKSSPSNYIRTLILVQW